VPGLASCRAGSSAPSGACASSSGSTATSAEISELRRSHQALLQILAVSQDLEVPAGDAAGLSKIKYLANDVIGVYARVDS
jgi:hypothetical protein